LLSNSIKSRFLLNIAPGLRSQQVTEPLADFKNLYGFIWRAHGEARDQGMTRIAGGRIGFDFQTMPANFDGANSSRVKGCGLLVRVAGALPDYLQHTCAQSCY